MDFVLGDGEVAVEVKGTSRVDNSSLKSLAVFLDEHQPRKALVVCNEKTERVVSKIRIVPWRRFLEQLWGGRIIR